MSCDLNREDNRKSNLEKMATFLSVLSHIMPYRYGCPNMSRIPAVGATFCIRKNSNTTSITRVKRALYPRMYPTLLVFPDGSTVNIRYHEPRRIIKLSLDFSKLSDAEKKKVLANRKPKQKLEKIEDFDTSIDLSEYSKFFQK